MTVAILPITGADINGDGKVDLTDEILGLQLNSLLSPDQKIYKQADMNGDGKIGLEEAIYILQQESRFGK